MRRLGHKRSLTALMASAAIAVAIPGIAVAQSTPAQSYNIPAQDLGKALTDLARQSNREIYFSADLTRGKSSPAVRGKMSTDEALARLLAGSGLKYSVNGNGAITIASAVGNGPVDAKMASSNGDESASSDQAGIAEILVVGSRSQNVDIRRTQDGPQAYIVFDKKEIERSGSRNAEEFLRNRLPMNSQKSSIGQQTFGDAYQGGVDLRGLGTDETLILVDGRRVTGASVVSSNPFGQAIITGIPSTAIERIEVLPSTAGGIYGGNANGGVVNIILKREYSGIEATFDLGATDDGNAFHWGASLVGGFSFGGGRTQVTFSGNMQSDNGLLASDRDLRKKGVERNIKNYNTISSDVLSANTPNICLAHPSGGCDLVSTNLVLDPAYGGVNLGSPFTSVPNGYAGPGSDNGQGLIKNAGRFNLGTNPESLLPDSRSNYLSLNVRQELSPNVSAFVTGSRSYSRDSDQLAVNRSVFLAAADPENPFQQDIFVNIPIQGVESAAHRKATILNVRGGAIAKLSPSWSLAVEYDWGRTRDEYGFPNNFSITSLSPASLAYLKTISTRDVRESDFNSGLFTSRSHFRGPRSTTSHVASARLSGTVASLPGGDLTLNTLVEARFDHASSSYSTYPTLTFLPSKEQRVYTGYAEARVPIVGSSNSLPWIHNLELVGALRHDAYQVNAPQDGTGFIPVSSTSVEPPAVQRETKAYTSNDYTFALRYEPVEGVAVRASLSSGFLPPNLGQLSSVSGPIGFLGLFYPDPKRGNTPVGMTPILLSGGNLDLDPEESHSQSFGVIIEPKLIPNLRMSLDFTKIDKRNEISSYDLQFFLNNEDIFPGRIIRGPKLLTDPASWAGPIVQLDSSLVNVAKTTVSALDFRVDYGFNTGRFGSFNVHSVITRQLRYERQALAGAATVDSIGFRDGPLKWRGTAAIDWTKDRWSAGWAAQYYGSYRVALSSALDGGAGSEKLQGARNIPSQFYQDIFVAYSIPKNEAPNWLRGTELRLEVQNVFDVEPPILSIELGGGSGGYSTYGDPRLRRFRFVLKKAF